eukprot:m.639638 g.639638  ORF g.639638 m.639638 type:complete len:379 (+) comp22616_c0_seq13:97-1233(+)
MKQRKKNLSKPDTRSSPSTASTQGENSTFGRWPTIFLVVAGLCIGLFLSSRISATKSSTTPPSSPQRKVRKSLQETLGKRLPGVNGLVKRIRINTANRLGPLKNYPLYVIDDFLPLELAENWRDAMSKEWNAGQGDDHGAWQFTSNNNGSANHNLNVKTRGNHNIQIRKEVSTKLNLQQRFAYRKWELPTSHPVVEDIYKYMESDEARRQVERILGFSSEEHLMNKSIEIFVTSYGVDDFLSSHDDSFGSDKMATYAFVVSLTAGPTWQEPFGGELSFVCSVPTQRQSAWCSDQSLSPTFNRAVLFKTADPPGPHHRVEPVRAAAAAAGFARFGYTGWYVRARDGLTQDAMKQRIRATLGTDLLDEEDERSKWEKRQA